MTVEPIGLIALLIGIIGLFRAPTFLVYAFVTSTLLGAAAAFNVTAIGGVSIPPAHLLFGFLAIRLVGTREIRHEIGEALSPGRPGFWLALTVILSLVTAYFMPRLFAGATFVFPVRAQFAGLVPLEPATSNVTQSVYFIADATCFLILSGFAATRGGIRVLLGAALLAATVNLVFAALDLITYFTNTAELLSFIRNANYTMLVETDVAGFKRIVGSFVEASSFGGATLGYFAFTGRLWLLGVQPRLTATLALLSLAAVLFATSTTAYVGLAVFLGLSYLDVLIRTMSGPSPPQMRLFVVGAPLMVVVLGFAVALSDTYSVMVRDLLDTFFFNKMSTASGQERGAWNQMALQSFFDTMGFGFGNGSGRASSFIIAALSSLGLFGSVPFAMFFISLFFGRGSNTKLDATEEAARQSAKSMCLAWLITGTVSDPLIELGLGFYTFAALAGASGFRMSPEALRTLAPSSQRYRFRGDVTPRSSLLLSADRRHAVQPFRDRSV
jgi:hypothetical protein